MHSTSLHSTDNFHDYLTNFSHMHQQPYSVEQHRGQSINASLFPNSLYRNVHASYTLPSHTKAIPTLQDIDVDSQLPTGIELDYSAIDNAMSYPATVNPMQTSDPLSTGERLNASAVVTAPTTDDVDNGPLLESEFYFEDILGDDGVPPDGLASIVKPDEMDDGESPIPKEYPSQHCSFFSPETAITNEELSPHSTKLDNAFSTGLFPTYNNSYYHVKPTEVSPDSSMYQIVKENTGPNSVSVSSSENVADPCPQHHEMELTGVENNVNVPHTFSDCEKFPMDEEDDDEDDDVNAMTGSPRSGTSMTNEQGYGTHPDLYENLTPEVQKHVDALREKIAAMPRRKLRESLAQSVTLEDVEPLMFINRDELAGMLGVGVTTWKTFMHSLGVPRWPARMLKSQKVKEEKLTVKREDAEKRGDRELVDRLSRDLEKLKNANSRRRRQLRANAQLRVANVAMKKR